MFEIIKDSSFYQSILNNSAYKDLIGVFILGFTIGYFIKKSFKVLLLLIFLLLLISFWFDYQTLNIDKTLNLSSFDTIIDIVAIFTDYIIEKISTFNASAIVAIVAGVLIGLKVG